MDSPSPIPHPISLSLTVKSLSRALATWFPNPTVRAESRFPNPTVRTGSAGGLKRGTVVSRSVSLSFSHSQISFSCAHYLVFESDYLGRFCRRIKTRNCRVMQRQTYALREFIYKTSGCPWPNATVKSPWVPVTFGHCFLFFLIFYCPGRTTLPALPRPYPALPRPCPALPLPCPCPTMFRIFLLLPGTGGGSYTGNGQCFFPGTAHTDRQTCCPDRRPL